MTLLSKAVTPTWCIVVLLFSGAFIGPGSALHGQDDDERCKLLVNKPVDRCEIVTVGDPLTYFKGTAEPREGWNSPDFSEGFDWLEGGNPIGYGDENVAFETELNDMPGEYWSVFTRSWFTVENVGRVEALRFWIRHDDGFVVYLNGEEIGRANLPNGALTKDTKATSHEFEDRPFVRTFNDVSTTTLVSGRNLVAVRLHNEMLNSSDAVLEIGVRVDIDLTDRPEFVRGADCDGAPALDIGDPVYLLRFQFGGFYPAPRCMSACDANDDGMLDLSDAVYKLNYLFQGGDPFPAPYPTRGEDRTSDDLGCEGV